MFEAAVKESSAVSPQSEFYGYHSRIKYKSGELHDAKEFLKDSFYIVVGWFVFEMGRTPTSYSLNYALAREYASNILFNSFYQNVTGNV